MGRQDGFFKGQVRPNAKSRVPLSRSLPCLTNGLAAITCREVGFRSDEVPHPAYVSPRLRARRLPVLPVTPAVGHLTVQVRAELVRQAPAGTREMSSAVARATRKSMNPADALLGMLGGKVRVIVRSRVKASCAAVQASNSILFVHT